MKYSIKSKVITGGAASGVALVGKTALSFWGGVDPHSGKIVDVHHDLCGACLSGRVLCIPFDRGSCSGSGVMLEMIRQGTAPAAIVCIEAEPVLAMGSVIGEYLYQRQVAIHTVAAEDLHKLNTGDHLSLDDNTIEITTPGRE